jgi:uncharacterized lipoprotein YmbA
MTAPQNKGARRMGFSPKITLITALMLLAACRSEPVHYHTLMPQQTGGAAHSNGMYIEFDAVSVPAQVDRTQIVIRQGNSGLVLLETDWWGASLSEELQSALAAQLINANPPRKLSLRVEVQRFDSVPGQYGLIEATWRLRGIGEGNVSSLTCHSTLQTPSATSIEDLVAAQQNNVKRLAAVIGQAARGSQQSCPSSG